jgi:serine/threonine protein kinase
MATSDLQRAAAQYTAAATEFRADRALVPDHELIRSIGKGSYGEVWLARSVLGALRAVKIVFRSRFADARPYEREFSGILRVEPLSRAHEGLVDILHVGRHEPEGYFYYVMELADDAGQDVGTQMADSGPPHAPGEPRVSGIQHRAAGIRHAGSYTPRTLARELKRRGRLLPQECVQLGLTLSSALSHIHQSGLIHRDVKPSNILYIGGVPKLGDIGLVGEVGDSASYVGTEGYIPPEGPGTVRADVFSLGKVLYEVTTGQDRLQFPVLPTALGQEPTRGKLVELNEVFLKACAPNPAQRYQTAEELHADLALLHRGQSLQRHRKAERRLRQVAFAGYAAAALAGLAIGCWWSPLHRQDSGTNGDLGGAPLPQQQPLDLSPFQNVAHGSNWTHDFTGNNLSSLPTGWQRLGPAHFDVHGLVQLTGGFLESRGLFFPTEVRGIPVNRQCIRLHFLHGAVWQAQQGVPVASYVIHYVDGRREEIPLRYGHQIQNWWWSPIAPITIPAAALAWTGTNAATSPENKVCLYAITWNNPYPATPIGRLDFVSAGATSCPFLLAVTAECGRGPGLGHGRR